MDDTILEVLKEIRDEAKQTNVRLASLDGRVEFLEKRTSKGFDSLNDRLESHVERLELLARQQAQSEIRLATEVLPLAYLAFAPPALMNATMSSDSASSDGR